MFQFEVRMKIIAYKINGVVRDDGQTIRGLSISMQTRHGVYIVCERQRKTSAKKRLSNDRILSSSQNNGSWLWHKSDKVPQNSP